MTLNVTAQWELTDAFNEWMWATFRESVRGAISEYYGDRCPDYQSNCIICRKWKAFDELFK